MNSNEDNLKNKNELKNKHNPINEDESRILLLLMKLSFMRLSRTAVLKCAKNTEFWLSIILCGDDLSYRAEVICKISMRIPYKNFQMIFL